MRDPNRIDLVLAKVKYIWEKHPDLRLGQLFCNCLNYGALYYSEDATIIKALEEFYKVDTANVTVAESTSDNNYVTLSKEQYEQLISLKKALVEEAVNKKTSSNRGRIYIHRGDQVKSIPQDELNNYLQDGWLKGRK